MRSAVVMVLLLVFAQNATGTKKSTLIIKADTHCQLSINDQAHGDLKANVALSLQLAPGKQLIKCVSQSQQVERSQDLIAGHMVSVQLKFPAQERFVRVAEGIQDNAQNLIWAQADNGRDIGWTDAKQYCAGLGKGWKLPNGTALQSLYDSSSKNELALDFNGTPYVLKPATAMIKFSGGGFWSDEPNESGVWGVNLATGARYTFTFDAVNFTRALCVRRV